MPYPTARTQGPGARRCTWDHQQLCEMRRKGMRSIDIVRATGVRRETLVRILRSYGLNAPSHQKIAP